MGISPENSMQPPRNQITRFELKHQDCAGPSEDGSYRSLVTGRRYTASYIAKNFSDEPTFYQAIHVG